MAKELDDLINQIGEMVVNDLNGVSHNRYTLTIDLLFGSISIL